MLFRQNHWLDAYFDLATDGLANVRKKFCENAFIVRNALDSTIKMREPGPRDFIPGGQVLDLGFDGRQPQPAAGQEPPERDRAPIEGQQPQQEPQRDQLVQS